MIVRVLYRNVDPAELESMLAGDETEYEVDAEILDTYEEDEEEEVL